jgi:hypothetical protein
MIRTLASIAIVLGTLASACTAREEVQGPPIAARVEVTSIVVSSLDSADARVLEVADPEFVEQAVAVFSPNGWRKNDVPLIPTHRFELRGSAGTLATYWVGSFSNPPRFPCYSFCSGYWAAASTPDGGIVSEQIKPLATSFDMWRVGFLIAPQDRGSQPNSALSPSHSAVTARAYSSTRCAVGRAG